MPAPPAPPRPTLLHQQCAVHGGVCARTRHAGTDFPGLWTQNYTSFVDMLSAAVYETDVVTQVCICLQARVSWEAIVLTDVC